MTDLPPLIKDTETLRTLCDALSAEEFIAIDTEFLRENTYYSQLCLIQVAAGDSIAAIDPLAPGIDLTPLFEVLKNEAIMKVFHAGRQDLEIFFTLMNCLPAPIYDTQIAAMVCGYGEQVGYDRLVKGVLDIILDKGPRFTDWAQRPLSDRQLRYALDDVIHLASIYPIIRDEIETANRTDWVVEEINNLANPAIYQIDPMDAWMKVKQRGNKPMNLNRLRYLAAWREEEARRSNMPKSRLIKDETLLALADVNPSNKAGFDRIRGFPGGASSKLVEPALKILKKANDVPRDDWPKVSREYRTPPPQAAADLLRVLLKHCAEDAGVAPRLIASSDELDRIALGERDGVNALTGWRGQLFGKDAIDLAEGRIALSTRGRKVHLHRLEKD